MIKIREIRSISFLLILSLYAALDLEVDEDLPMKNIIC